MIKADRHWERRIGRRLKLRDLHILLAVVERRSMAKAAAYLAVTQPAVSQAISNLEHTLGVRLLDRITHGVVPTPYGLALSKRGLAVFDELSQGVRDIAFLSDPTTGEVRIGCPESIAAALLTAIVERFSLQYPRVVIHVVQLHDISPEFRELRERNVDLVLARIPTPFAADDLNAEILLNDNLFVIAGTQSPWARRRKLQLAELINEPWVLPPPNTMFGSRVMETFQAKGLDLPRASVVSLSMHLRNNLLATGRFLSIDSGSVLSFSAQRFSLKALPIDLPARVGAIAIVTLKNRTVSPTANLFIECARAVAEPTPTTRHARQTQA